MKVESPRFGSLDVDSSKLIQFPAGLPGFEECKQFTFLEVGELQAQALGVLQSIDRPDVAFSVGQPDMFGLHYEFALSDDEEKLLQASRAEDLTVLLILRREDEQPLKANLMAPLVINTVSRIGFQKVIARIGCDVTLRPA